jgi:hypothetical protein
MTNRLYLFGEPTIRLPLQVTSARRGVGSFLTLDLAEPSPELDSVGSQWSIWVYLCDWSLRSDGEELLNSDCSDDSSYEHALARLTGGRLLRTEIRDENETAELIFDGGITLFVDDASDIYGENRELLMVFNGRKCISVLRSGIGMRPE